MYGEVNTDYNVITNYKVRSINLLFTDLLFTDLQIYYLCTIYYRGGHLLFVIGENSK